MKYVIIDDGGIDVAILFDALFKHDRFASMKPVSAGFVVLEIPKFGLTTVEVHGKSVSLGLHSRPQDTRIIAETLMRKVGV